jgi:mRNA interferase MazF
MDENALGGLPLRIVVPITVWKEIHAQAPWFIGLSPTDTNGLSKQSAANAFQVKSLSENRFVQKLGELTPDEVKHIAAAIALCVGYVP